MRCSICYIDDRIPAIDEAVNKIIDNTKKLDETILKLLLTSVNEENWDEKEVRDLITLLLGKEDILLSAFTNPSFYFNHNQSEIYRPEIFILDWDYNGDTNDTEDYLKQLLDYSFCFIAIYTRYDKLHEIEAILEKPEFLDNKNRIVIWHKEDSDSVDKLIANIMQLREENFSFKFGHELRKNAIDATERILLDLGASTSNDISKYFQITDDSNKDLIDFISERFKSYLASSKLKVLDEKEIDEVKIPEHTLDELAGKLWSHRLYYYPSETDQLFRKGDIFIKDGIYHLVISADCDLAKFWHKNFGSLNCIKLYPFDEKDVIKEKLLLTRKADIKSKLFQFSLISDVNSLTQGPFILPFLRVKTDGQILLKDFFAFPKDTISFSIPAPDTGGDKTKLSKLSLKYGHLENSVKLASLTEPFLTQTVEHILNVLRGFGVPDYPKSVVELLHNKTKQIFE